MCKIYKKNGRSKFQAHIVECINVVEAFFLYRACSNYKSIYTLASYII